MVTSTVISTIGSAAARSVQKESSAEDRLVLSLAAALARLCIHSCTVSARSGTKRDKNRESHSKKRASAGRKAVL